MAGSGKKWLIGCGAGCAGMILLSILFSVGGALIMSRPMNRAVDAQRDLTERFGIREEYAPPARLEPERVEVFLAVRSEVMGSCEKIQELVGRFQAMEELDSGEGDPAVGDILKGVKGVMGAAFGMAQTMGEITQRRNEVLGQQGMGLGEYTWIYVLAYNSYLGKLPNTGIDSQNGREYSGRKLRLISTLMENHAIALDEAADSAAAKIWRDEAARLTRVDEGVPFPEGTLPDGLAAVFAPYRKRLQKNYCPAMAEFDLDRLKKKGMSFHSD